MRKTIFFAILILIVTVAGYVYWNYYNIYSDGYREGILQKFSRKGNVLKTFEGEIVQLGFGQRGGNFNSNYFYFSVTDQAVADTLQMCMGKVVKMHYLQYRRALPWRGDNYNTQNADKGQYIVDKLVEVKEAQAY